MGNKLENVKRNVETAESIEQRGLEQGEKDGSEVREIKSILEGMDKDVDEDILAAIGETREAAKSEAADHMNSEVHSTLEEGYQHANEAIQEGTDQAGRSRQSAAEFSRSAGVSEFGRSTAEQASSNAENIGQQFEQSAESAQRSMEDTESRFNNIRDEILG